MESVGTMFCCLAFQHICKWSGKGRNIEVTVGDVIKLLRIIKSKSDCKMLQKDTGMLRDREMKQQI